MPSTELTAEEFIAAYAELADDETLSEREFRSRADALMRRLREDERDKAAALAFARVPIRNKPS
jgi:hypothetical protein